MILFIGKVINKLSSIYRKKVFEAYTNNKGKGVKIYGKMTLINRNVKCGKNVSFYPDVMLFGDGLIEIGDNVDIGNGTIIYASKAGGGVKIGNNTSIAAQCYIIDMDHGIHAGKLIRDQENTVSPIQIMKDVWIAAGCKILKGSIIHDGAIIGAASLVKGEIPENAIAFGCPAKVKKYRE